MLLVVSEGIKRYGSDLVFRFYYVYGILMEDREVILELDVRMKE